MSLKSPFDRIGSIKIGISFIMDAELTLVDLKDNITETFAKFEENLNGAGSSPLKALRAQALTAFKETTFPTIKHEEWKYTNLRKLLSIPFAWEGVEESQSTELNPDWYFGLEEANLLVFVNGKFSVNLSKVVDTAFEVTSIAEADGELIEQHFSKYAKVESEPFTALNTAFAAEGVFIHVPKGKVVEKPVVLLYINNVQEKAVFSQPRNLIVVEESAQINLIENFVSVGAEKSFSNLVSEIVVESNARVNHYKLQNEQPTVFHIGTTQVLQHRDSYYNNLTFTLAGGLTRNNVNLVLDGENCESHLFGLYMMHRQDHVDNHTSVDHKQPHSFSNELYKGILDDEAKGVFNGKVYVRQYAQKTNAFQSNKNILLSPKASVDTKPQLEIWADDVKCSHGATTGAMDEEPLFYLRSRGIGEDKAKALLMHAFAADLLEEVKIPEVKDHIEKLIDQRLLV
ncbi:Fe-S cluster assembly protein SufD [Rapidithrix thailandica]|uniref:Fe-S cluster assembly protein SufD n=1 Tax=Rapidithrix thailandica TaxID=413964 RepID=A0AAW9S2L4_9BACT